MRYRAGAALVTNNELRIPKGREFPPQPVPGSESDFHTCDGAVLSNQY